MSVYATIKVGDAPQPLVCGPLTRTGFRARYVGAPHDFPIIMTRSMPRRTGNKTVFGMGMLAGGYRSRLITDWLASARCNGCASALRRGSA